MVTHRHSDHEGGASFLVSHFAPQAIHANGPSRALPKSVVAKAGDAWEIDGVHFRVLNPGNDLERDENERSLVLQVGYGRTEMLLMGDAGTRTESHLSLHDSYALVKVGHHGAATSSSPRFVAATRPRIAVISVGTRNRFAHPSADVVKRWKTAGSAVWRTDRDATLHLASDGDAITFK